MRLKIRRHNKKIFLLAVLITLILFFLSLVFAFNNKSVENPPSQFQEQKLKIANISYDQAFNIATRYLQKSSQFRQLNLDIRPYESKYQLKNQLNTHSIIPKYVSLNYQFIIQPRDSDSDIESGRIWVDAITGDIYLLDLRYKKEPSTTVVIEENKAFELSQSFLTGVDIAINNKNFKYTIEKAPLVHGYRTYWQEYSDNIPLPNSVAVTLDGYGRFIQLIHGYAPVTVDLKPTLNKDQAVNIAKSFIEKDYGITESQNIEEKLVLLTNPLETVGAKQSLIWLVTLENISHDQGVNVRNAYYYIDAHSGEKVYTEYHPLFIQ